MALNAAEADVMVREGVAAMQRRDAATARRLFETLADPASGIVPPWILLAQACRLEGDHAAEEVAVDRLLADQPRNLRALVMKGDCRARQGDDRAATSFYSLALKAAPTDGSVPQALAADLQRVSEAVQAHRRDYQAHMESALAAIDGGEAGPRFRQAIDILAGRKQVYVQQPNSFYYPGLPQIQFYERGAFPWVAEMEAATSAIRDELTALMAEGEAFAPYVQGRADRPRPANPLFEDPRWGAAYILKEGVLVPEMAERCPRTVAALEAAPMPHIRGRSPMALFSRLHPGTHIQPHNGLLNTRLICHLPLIVPPGCRFRVGNEVREWEEGKMLIFDDSIEHEAWNDGDSTRVVLLFEIWRPEIDAAERQALTALFESIVDY
ncbi:hypothetical protein ACFB49_03410 [Sphingomonas sp. DBB INV C78]|uniref:aspartyl/asparaginyl beta-hydroxylase domain-containing protein n=1 Tax=Sphingomonas sp. DBB INV C78 TaxID=3349434 RepID=UPI0036D28C2D